MLVDVIVLVMSSNGKSTMQSIFINQLLGTLQRLRFGSCMRGFHRLVGKVGK